MDWTTLAATCEISSTAKPRPQHRRRSRLASYFPGEIRVCNRPTGKLGGVFACGGNSLGETNGAEPCRRKGKSNGSDCRSQVAADVHDVIRDDAKSDPAPHAARALIAIAGQLMSAFEDAEACFTPGTPFHRLLEPAGFLSLPAGLTPGCAIGNSYPLDTHLFGGGLVRRGAKPAAAAATNAGARPHCCRCLAREGVSR